MEYTLVLNENFTISNGPDLYVYVSKEQQPSQFVSLGKLKSVNGGQTYTFTGSVNFDEYKYAVVHCQQYNHLFSYALLEKNNITNMKNYINWALRLSSRHYFTADFIFKLRLIRIP
jgi:hypothetical protein